MKCLACVLHEIMLITLLCDLTTCVSVF